VDILKDVVIILFCFLGIGTGAAWLVESAVKVARRIGMSELVVGLTVVALGTSAPEFGVTVLAAIRGMGDISVGNIVGSNIFNLGFILGGTAIIHSLKTNRTIVNRDGLFLLFGTTILTVFLWDLRLSRIEGVLLFGLLIIYLFYLYRNKQPLETDIRADDYKWWDSLKMLLGMLLLLGSSHFLVDSSVDLARRIGISEWVIGATIVAAGTSTPEFATSIVAALRGRYGISVGNLIGSDIFNIYGVLGLASILRNLPVDEGARVNMMVLVVMVVLVIIFMRSGWIVTRKEGYALVTLGIMRWVYSFW
jgi:cation:H+ antiporter